MPHDPYFVGSLQSEIFLYGKQIDDRVPVPEALKYVTDIGAQESRFPPMAHLFSSLRRADHIVLVVPLRFRLDHCVHHPRCVPELKCHVKGCNR